MGEGKTDSHYASRRRALFLVAVQCAEPAATCFCASTGDGPTPQSGFDLSLAELADGFVVTAGSDAGTEILAGLDLPQATAEQVRSARQQGETAARKQTRSLPDRDLRPLLMSRLEHAQWSDVAARCLSCGNCTAVCPTCFCHAHQDELALGAEASTHVRHWDSCFNEGHAYLHGYQVRPDTRSRYRQWLVHKLATWHDQYGRSGCVGCGRCISWCPTGIDITAEVAAMQGEG
jgi:sulfhydrogenase subunit beta (sulfur reductase)